MASIARKLQADPPILDAKVQEVAAMERPAKLDERKD